MKNSLAMLFLFSMMLFAASGCEQVIPRVTFSYEKVCSKEQTIAVTDFVLQCAKNANPLSDEEGEDLVAECRNSGILIICQPVPSFTFCQSQNAGCTTMPCAQASTAEEKETCETHQRVYVRKQEQD